MASCNPFQGTYVFSDTEIAEACRGSPPKAYNGKTLQLLAQCTKSATVRDPRAIETERHMLVFLYLEASQPCGSRYRLGIGCLLHPKLASMVVMLVRLF